MATGRPPSGEVLCKICTKPSLGSSPSRNTLLICFVITVRSLPNKRHICSCVNHTVSPSVLTGNSLPSDDLYTIICCSMPFSFIKLFTIHFYLFPAPADAPRPWGMQSNTSFRLRMCISPLMFRSSIIPFLSLPMPITIHKLAQSYSMERSWCVDVLLNVINLFKQN